MTVEFNHTIAWCRNKETSARFLAEILGRPDPVTFGPFKVVELDNGASLDFRDTDGKPAFQHYAFLIDDATFDAVFDRIKARDIPYWADPGRTHAKEINERDGGRGFYFMDPDGHLLLEVLTRPYGSGA